MTAESGMASAVVPRIANERGMVLDSRMFNVEC